ncbi:MULTISPECIES: hypothetical protein [unclassified Nocardia]|uniref:hypothetical protein n=1 Tax=unclassified Nocardia TaxID=2637762 RepID=UPI001CE4149A|nr:MULTISPECIES: hypothetical protein [unclassified Nocardia]
MSRRISQSIAVTTADVTALRTPFISKGANDPIVAELRRVLKDAVPDWLAKLTEGQELTQPRLEEIQAAIDTYRRLIEFLLPEGAARADALANLEQAEASVKEMGIELTGASAFSGINA